MFGRVHHVAYVVPDMDEAIAFFQQRLDLELERRGMTDSGETEFATFLVDGAVVELLAPASPASPRHQTLKERGGPCLDHVAFAVHKLDSVLATLAQRGITLTDGPYVPGTGWRIVNIDPKTTLGIGLQFVDEDYKG